MPPKLLSYIFVFGLLLQEAIRFPHRMANKRARHARAFDDDRSQGADTWVSFVAAIGLELLPLFLAFTTWLDGFNYAWPALASWLGVPFLVASTWLLWRAHADLGRNWSPTLQVVKKHKLVTKGIYAWLRHPIYASLWLFAIAQALMLPNWIVAPAGLLSVLLVTLVRIPREEQMMIDHYGDEYRAYAQRVGGLLPRGRA